MKVGRILFGLLVVLCSLSVTAQLSVEVHVESNQICCGNIEHFASATPSGGCEPYTYLWSTPTTAATTELEAGAHWLVITDACGETAFEHFEITEPPTLIIAYFETEYPSTNDSFDGQLFASVFGGVWPYTELVIWRDQEVLNNQAISFEDILDDDGNVVGQNITHSGIGPGLYNMFIYDSGNCGSSAAVLIEEHSHSDQGGNDVQIDGQTDDQTDGQNDNQTEVQNPDQNEVQLSFANQEASALDMNTESLVLGESTLGANINLYPNPATDILTLSTSKDLSDSSIEVVGMNGQVYSVISQQISATSQTLDIRHLPTGLYQLVLKSHTGLTARKFQKK